MVMDRLVRENSEAFLLDRLNACYTALVNPDIKLADEEMDLTRQALSDAGYLQDQVESGNSH